MIELELREIYEYEAEEAAKVEAICFPPSEACTLPIMQERVHYAGDCFLVAIEKATGKMIGFINGLCTDDEVLHDELFTDTSLHMPTGKNVMICGVDVLPDYRFQGIARRMMQEFLARQKALGREKAILTCVPEKVEMYRKFGYTDRGPSDSTWGGEAWHEMFCILNEKTEECFDVVDESGDPTGETVTRSIAHAEGIRHRTAHIWITKEVDGHRQVLLQKRALTKDSFPGRYDTSSAGHIAAGDEPLASALRELSEELGIFAEPDDLHFAGTFRIQYEKEFHGKLFKDNEIAFVYVYSKEVAVDQLVIQKEELDSVAWFDLEEVYQECLKHNQKFCVPVKGLETARTYLSDSENTRLRTK